MCAETNTKENIKGELINLWIANECFPYVLGNNVLFDTELFLHIMELTVRKIHEQDQRTGEFRIRYIWTYRGEIFLICDAATAVPKFDLAKLTALTTVTFNRVLRDEVMSYFAPYAEHSDTAQKYTDYQNAINSDLYFIGTAEIFDIDAIIANLESEERILINDTSHWLSQIKDEKYVEKVIEQKPQILYGTSFSTNYAPNYQEKKFWDFGFESYLKGCLS